jgi:hypothetical protein
MTVGSGQNTQTLGLNASGQYNANLPFQHPSILTVNSWYIYRNGVQILTGTYTPIIPQDNGAG